MNKIIFILLFFSATWCTQSFADIKHVPTTKKSSTLSNCIKTLKEKKSDSYLIDSDTSKNVPDSSKKKKRIKGIQPECCFFLPGKTIFKANVIESEYVYTTQRFYFSRLVFSNEKRGPPAVL